MTVAMIIRNSWAWKNLKSTNARGPRSAFMLTAIQVDTGDTNDADQTWDYKSFLLGPFKCPGCDSVTFSNRRALDLHMRKIHKAGIVECDECGRKVLDLKRHKEILHKWELTGWKVGGCQCLFFVCRRFKIYSCPHCSDKYCTQEDLERHLLKVWRKTYESGFNKCKINMWGCLSNICENL